MCIRDSDTTRIYIMESGREHERLVEKMGLVFPGREKSERRKTKL